MGGSIPLLASAVSALGGLVFGYELGIISGALLQLKAEFRLSCVQQEALVSSLLIGALLASITGGSLIDRQGRRNSILLSNILILTGSLILLISSYSALVVGRIIVGFAMCISSMSCCIFVSEMVAADRRGFLVTLYEAGITVGILAAYAMNYILSNFRSGWKWMFGLAILPTLIQLISIWFLPSSKGSLSQTNFFQGERELMSSFDNQEANYSKVSSSIENKRVQYNSMYLFQRKDNMRTRTVIGIGLVLFQQFTGQPNILLYASTIFQSVGFQSNASAVLASVGLGFVKVIATVTSMVFSDRAGRRPLLISGCSSMAVCLIIIGLLSENSLMNAKRPCISEDFNMNKTDLPHLTAGNQSNIYTPINVSQELLYNNTQGEDLLLEKGRQKPTDIPLAYSPSIQSPVENWIILVCMMAVVSAYSIGFGPMTWLLLSEIFPAAVRGRAFAFANCFNWAANLLVTFTFLNFIGLSWSPPAAEKIAGFIAANCSLMATGCLLTLSMRFLVLDAIGLSGMFLIYGVSAVAAGIFFYFMLPETKGKTLEEIDKELRLNRFYHSEKCCSIFNWRNTSRQYQRVHCQVSTSE